MENPLIGKRRWLWRTALLFLAAFILMRLYFRATDDFRISNISYEMPYHAEWEIPMLTSTQQQELEAILNQKFRYLGKGAQSYVFASDDGKYVIKFFKFKHLRPSWFVDMLPDVSLFSQFKQKVSARKARKLFGVFNGYKLAYDKEKADSGLIFIQLNPSHKEKVITVVDKIGFDRHVDLGAVPYIVQEKGKTLRLVFGDLIEKGDMETLKKRIVQIFNLYLAEYRQGINDHDHGVMHNAGFVGDRPIHLDVGKIHAEESMKQPATYQEDLLLVAAKMDQWLQENYPDQADEIKTFILQWLSHNFGRDVRLPSVE